MPQAAADAPRFWSDGAERIRAESRISEAARSGLVARGIEVEELGDYNYHTGSMQIVWRDRDGRLHGTTDARRLGWTQGH